MRSASWGDVLQCKQCINISKQLLMYWLTAQCVKHQVHTSAECVTGNAYWLAA